jgi:hypothetical protein
VSEPSFPQSGTSSARQKNSLPIVCFQISMGVIKAKAQAWPAHRRSAATSLAPAYFLQDTSLREFGGDQQQREPKERKSKKEY